MWFAVSGVPERCHEEVQKTQLSIKLRTLHGMTWSAQQNDRNHIPHRVHIFRNDICGQLRLKCGLQ